MFVYLYSYQPEGWLDPHTVPAPDAHTQTPMHTQAHTHKYTYSTPHTTTARRTKPGVEWGRVASSFPLPYCTKPGNDEVHYLAKVILIVLLNMAEDNPCLYEHDAC
jgi:hypothetical protein